MKKNILSAFIALLVLVLSVSCKDSQMDNDPMGELTVKLTGTVTPPPDWEHPMVYAYYPRDGREYGAVIVAPVKNDSFSLFVEKNTDVEIYLFNDVDNNGSFDYLTEPKLPHSSHPFVGINSDFNAGEVIVRKVSGELTYPNAWDKPTMYIMKGNDIYAYYPITPGVNPAPYTFYTGDGNDYKIYVFNDSGGQDADGVYDYTTENSIAYSGNPLGDPLLGITADMPNQYMKVWEVTGTVSVPADWLHPKMVILKNNAVVTYGDIANSTYSMYIIEGTDYEVYMFNDLDNNGVYDYQTETLYTHLTAKLTVNATTTLSGLNVRTITGTTTLPSTWSAPKMMLLNGNIIIAYSSLTSGAYTFNAVEGSGYMVYAFNDDNGNGTYDYLTEKKYTHLTSSLSISANTNIDTSNGSLIIRTVSGTITSIPIAWSKPILALTNRASGTRVNPCETTPSAYTDHSFSYYYSINPDGTYKLYDVAKSNYKLWIINDENGNGAYDYANREPYVLIPERMAGSLADDTAIIDLTSQDATLNVKLGQIVVQVTDYNTYSTPGWSYTGIYFYQNWDGLDHQSSNRDKEYFYFTAVSEYTLNSVTQNTIEYQILPFDDDFSGIYDGKTYSAQDGIYLYINSASCGYSGDNDEFKWIGTKYQVEDSPIPITID